MVDEYSRCDPSSAGDHRGSHRVAIVFAPSLIGVIAFERNGPLRCVILILDRFWASVARLMVGWLLATGYEALVGSLVTGSLAIPVWPWQLPVVISHSPFPLPLGAFLLVPVDVLASAMQIITYAELRRADLRWDVTAGDLAGELATTRFDLQ